MRRLSQRLGTSKRVPFTRFFRNLLGHRVTKEEGMDARTGHAGAGFRTALALLAFGMLASFAAGCATATARPPRSEFEDIAVPRGLTYQPDKSTEHSEGEQ